MNCKRLGQLLVPAAFLLTLAAWLPANAADGVLVQEDELVVICQDNLTVTACWFCATCPFTKDRPRP